jgi:hypothetical protein
MGNGVKTAVMIPKWLANLKDDENCEGYVCAPQNG